jgi:methionyl-tRNA formyltransferase
MKIAFMGTPDFAVPTLERLISSGHEVKLVVTQPSKPKGRGQKPADPPVKLAADRQGIAVIQPASLKRDPIDQKIRDLGIDLIVVVAYGKLLPKSLLEAPRLGAINVHASLLPEYRGAAPIQRALMDGRFETGVTIMKMVEALDAGPIITQHREEIHDDDDALSLANLLSVVGADLLARVLEDIEEEGTINGIDQDESQATYAPMIKKSEGEIDWSMPSERIMFRLRGLTPWPGLYTVALGSRAKVIQAEVIDQDEAEHIGALESQPGTISGIVKDVGFTVKTGDGHLLIRRIQPEGKREMDAEEYMRGYTVVTGRALASAPVKVPAKG